MQGFIAAGPGLAAAAGPIPMGLQWGNGRGPFGPLPFAPQPLAEEGVTTVFVGGFDNYFVGEADVFYTFVKCGPISQIKIPRDKGIAFIIFQHKESAQRAIHTMQGAILAGGFQAHLEWGRFASTPANSTTTVPVYAHKLTALERAVNIEPEELPPGLDDSPEASKHSAAASSVIAAYHQTGFQPVFGAGNNEANPALNPAVGALDPLELDVSTVDGFNALLSKTTMESLAASSAQHIPPEAHNLAFQALEGAKQAALVGGPYYQPTRLPGYSDDRIPTAPVPTVQAAPHPFAPAATRAAAVWRFQQDQLALQQASDAMAHPGLVSERVKAREIFKAADTLDDQLAGYSGSSAGHSVPGSNRAWGAVQSSVALASAVAATTYSSPLIDTFAHPLEATVTAAVMTASTAQ
jgi:RNA recognition motif. (a.k.a. RRM, RBD, or RNP domain)